ncbi:PREDICTED: uncharacterized protein LOC106111652 [Papilio polytes]|uniref:uncharacterized protein LOC106111652 n=1 Tax=Papilio polytes TaxID=76194 RepID=UPI0006764FA7|nr:PREDICTED: uncharacterized protein LOC106111652 [Papilio polytes]
MSPDGFKELTKKRSSFKGQLTSFVNYCKDLKPPLDSVTLKELQLRTGRIEALYARFDEVQLQIECLVDEVDAQYVSREDFESKYYKALSNAQDLLAACSNSPSSDFKSITSNRKLVKLPTIQLPKFNGSYENWLEFRDTFASLIHSNDDIDDINKFHYLRACLESSAAVVIKSIEFSASNYSVAWKVLCERYDNKRLLIQNHVVTLFNIEPIPKESSCSIKQLIDQLKKNLRALEALGEPVEYWDTLLIYLTTKKLDPRTYREWEEFKGRTDEDTSKKFSEFMKFLRSRADLLETLELSHINPIKSISKFKSMVSTQQINKYSSSNANLPSRLCPKCKGDHNLSSCSQFLALSNEARFKILPTFKICFNCFRSGHYANHCRKPGCNVCKRRHNSLIHVSDWKPVRNNNNLRNENVKTRVDSTPSTSSASNVDQYGQSLSANVRTFYRAS